MGSLLDKLKSVVGGIMLTSFLTFNVLGCCTDKTNLQVEQQVGNKLYSCLYDVPSDSVTRENSEFVRNIQSNESELYLEIGTIIDHFALASKLVSLIDENDNPNKLNLNRAINHIFKGKYLFLGQTVDRRDSVLSCDPGQLLYSTEITTDTWVFKKLDIIKRDRPFFYFRFPGNSTLCRGTAYMEFPDENYVWVLLKCGNKPHFDGSFFIIPGELPHFEVGSKVQFDKDLLLATYYPH